MIRNLFTSLIALSALFFLNACSTPQGNKPQPEVRNAMPTTRVAQPPAGDPSLWPAQAPSIFAISAIMIDANTGETLYQKNADAPRPVASTQKLLTGLVVAENDSLDTPFVIDAVDTYVEPTKLGLRAGTVCTRRQLLSAMMVKSCNDAAAALARGHSGSTSAFANEMNRYAQSIGATNSYFANPHGLPATQHSSARDMARIAFRAYRNSTLRSLMRLPGYTFVSASGRSTYLESTNKLLRRSDMFNGMKTGFTNASGKCLVASATYGGRNVILVQLGSKSQYIFDDAERMLRWGITKNSYIPSFAMQDGGTKFL